MSVFLLSVFAGEIYVTDVKSQNGPGGRVFEITINRSVIIKDIRLVNADREKLLEFPEYVSQSGHVYPQVVFNSTKTSDYVKFTVINNSVTPAGNCKTEFKITKFEKFLKKSKLKALASVSFNDELEVECKIIESKHGPWVAWPSKKSEKSGEWEKQVFVLDKKLREGVEKALLQRYKTLKVKERKQFSPTKKS